MFALLKPRRLEVARKKQTRSIAISLKMLAAPRPNRPNDRAYGFSVAGDAVLDPRGNLRIGCAPDESFILQIAERCGLRYLSD